MNTIHKYISNQFLLTFFMALVVLSFVMSVGLIFKAVSLISRGASTEIVLRFIWGGFPFTLSYSIPISLLVCSLLVFGRLSSDSEIMAMRACGVSLFDIMRLPLLISLLLSIFCLYLNNNVSPESSYSRKTNRNAIGVNEVAAMIEPGKTIKSEDFGDGISIFVKERDGKNLTNVRIVEPLDTESGAYRELSAQRAEMTAEENNSILKIDLYDVIINTFSASGIKDMTSVKAASLPFQLSIKDEKQKSAIPTRRPKDKPSWQLAADLQLDNKFPTEDQNKRKNLARSKVEIFSRISLAFSCFCFVLIGIPLGIKQHRKESYVGLGLSLAVAGGFYLFAILGESLAKHQSSMAHIVVIIPVFICIGLGSYLIKRGN
ncbi:MAG: LptF/LptG family permease [Kiritimatiellae bacterium]|nr:LptF/LptG family permease [Kiritimatiellia bacterium]